MKNTITVLQRCIKNDENAYDYLTDAQIYDLESYALNEYYCDLPHDQAEESIYDGYHNDNDFYKSYIEYLTK